ncbi:hypothetical protein AVEN_129744-1 [Araneus ventricosus]|uniref:Uncharacterized protein n=1 Tax=Araneus ventricosus TaxID=182803 RepID=A0A4Y2VJ86_ARAVE|nr:hypothetical protein AVEN_129744-1 [Araneus ventricosus]
MPSATALSNSAFESVGVYSEHHPTGLFLCLCTGFDISYGVPPGLIKLDFIQLGGQLNRKEPSLREALRGHGLLPSFFPLLVPVELSAVSGVRNRSGSPFGNASFHGHVRDLSPICWEIIRVGFMNGDGSFIQRTSTLRKMLIAAVAFPMRQLTMFMFN